MRVRCYIGLATTHHDPAIAIVGPDGDIRFAEASERHLQYKRAFGCPPDLWGHVAPILRAHVPADAELVVATSWSRRQMALLGLLGALGFSRFGRVRDAGPELTALFQRRFLERAYTGLLARAQHTAGLAALAGIHEAFGHLHATLRRYPHHLAHAAYACFTSPFPEAACAVVDGIGETGFATFYRWADGRLRPVGAHWGRESLGFLYALVTELCGFDPSRGEEWKVMGLAPYGRPDPALQALFGRLYRLDGDRVRFAGARRIRETVAELRARVRPEAENALAAADLARVGQDAFAAIMRVLLGRLARHARSPNLVLTGGCALNSSFNGTVVGTTAFERLYVPPAPGDDGNAVGAALLAWAEDHPGARRPAAFQTPYLGSRLAPEAVLRFVRHGGLRVRRLGTAIARETAVRLAAGRLVGWVQGRAEFGPRALGNRSILADPRRPDVKDAINARVKRREPFRPFAPAILHEHGADFFEAYQESPYMERTLRFRPAVVARVPGVVHVDGTGRLQTVKREWNADFHALLAAYHELTGVPVLLNTSFNVMGRPIAHTLEDAVALFHTSGLDVLAVDDWLIEKTPRIAKRRRRADAAPADAAPDAAPAPASARPRPR